MTAPPGNARQLTSTTEPAGSRDTARATLHPRIVAREFSRLFREHGIAAHPAEVRTIATKFCATVHNRLEDIETYVLKYADPTGETAVRNVMRGGARG